MHTFLFLARLGGSARRGRMLLERASASTTRLRPNIGEVTRASVRMVQAIDGGYWCHGPDGDSLPSRISETSDDTAVVLCWGEVFEDGGTSAAVHVRDAWGLGGIEAVRLINGSFSAIVVDLTENTIHLLSDTVGKRTLRFAVAGDAIVVSPHDLPIVATGLIPVEWDHVSAASLLACGWSMGGHSLLKGIDVCSPHTVVSWHAGRVETAFKPLVAVGRRLHRRDRKQISAHLDRMIEYMKSSVSSHAGPSARVRCDLTAGFDSRALLAIVHDVVDPQRIELSTSETIDRLDARVASDIARRLQLDHTRFVVNDAGGSFVENCRLRAFMMNGSTNARRALGAYPHIDELAVPHYFGGGGEIHRGFYYPRARLAYHTRCLSLDETVAHIERIVFTDTSRTIVDQANVDPIKERLRVSLASLTGISDNPTDIADLFYLNEKYRHWGSYASRLTWKNWMSPFELPAVIRLAFRLPSPIGAACGLHKKIIRTLLPDVYRIPVNGGMVIPLLGDALPRVAIRAGLSGTVRVGRALARVLGRKTGRIQQRQWSRQSDVIRGYLSAGLRDILVSGTSIGCEVIGKKRLEQIVDAQWGNSGQHLRTIGFLLTMEMFREMVEDCGTAMIDD